jgi:SAM-dependent methyltransferase
MERAVYLNMAEVEDEHWWFVARRRILAGLIERTARLPKPARVLEAGCGTGGNLPMFARFGAVCAFEPDEGARLHARAKGAYDVRSGSLPDSVPFEAGSFDLVAALDILEHLDDAAAGLAALASRVRAGGWMVITVPAFRFLWSRHDERHHHKRRYARGELVALVRAAGLTPVRVSYFNSLLFAPIAGARMVQNVLGLDGGEDEALPPRALNRLLGAVFASERHLLGRIPFPVGVSLMVIARAANS